MKQFTRPILVFFLAAILSEPSMATGISIGEPIPYNFYLHKGERKMLFGYGFVGMPDNNGNSVAELFGYSEVSQHRLHWLSHNPDFSVENYLFPRQHEPGGAGVWVSTADLLVGQTYSLASGICDEPTGGTVGTAVCVQVGNRFLTIVPYDVPIYEAVSIDGSNSHIRFIWGNPSPLYWNISSYSVYRRDDDSVRLSELQSCVAVRAGLSPVDTLAELHDAPRGVRPFYAIVGFDSLGEAVAVSENIRVNPAPGAFHLLLPADGYLVPDGLPAFSWEIGAGGPYTLWYGTDSTFSIHEEIPNIPENSRTLSQPLQEDGNYYWKVRANDGTWSAETGWQFRICAQPSPPQDFSLISPIDGDTLLSRLPSLSWQEACDPGDLITYRILIAKDAGFGEIVLDTTTSLTYYHSVRMLDDDSRYYWKVCALDASNHERWSASIGSFVLSYPDPPQAFEIVQPIWSSPGTGNTAARSPRSLQTTSLAHDPYDLSSATTTTRFPRFVWRSSVAPDPGDEIRYTLQLSADSLFRTSTTFEGIADTFFLLTEPLNEDQFYYWKVTALNRRGARRGSLGLPQAFLVNEIDRLPSEPQPVYPLVTDSILTTGLNLRWTRSTDDPYDLLVYSVHISTREDFADTVFQTPYMFLRDHVGFSEIDPGSYFWRVRVRSYPLSGDLPAEVDGPAAAFVVRPRHLNILSPLAVSNWKAGSVALISWTANYPVSVLKLEYTVDQGATWQTIADSAQYTPTYFTWTVPEAIGQARVRVTDQNRHEMTATSEPFSITVDGSPDRILVYFPFDGSAIDSSGNGINGSFGGGSYVSDRFGSASRAWSGAKDGSSPFDADFSHGFSASMWIYMSLESYGGNLLMMSGPSSLQWRCLRGGAIQFQVSPGPLVEMPSPTNSQWVHVVATLDTAGYISLYFNSSLVTVRQSGILSSGVYHMRVCEGVSGVDDVRIYSRIISQAEILSLMKEKAPPGRKFQLLSPNGGELFHFAKACKITWAAGAPAPATLQYSRDGGRVWSNIVEGLSSEITSYDWTIPVFDTASVQLSVRVMDILAPYLADESDTTFTARTSFVETARFPVYSGTAVWGDVNMDGKMDLLCPGIAYPGGGGIPGWYLNSGNEFTPWSGQISFPTYPQVVFGDPDNDGDLDMLSSAGKPYLALTYFSNSEFNFTAAGLGIPQRYDHSIARWGDIDNDGDLDLFFEGKIYLNDLMTFSSSIALPGAPYECDADWCDFDGDGDLDLLVAASTFTKVYRNDAGTMVDTEVSLPVVFDGRAKWLDANGDGRWDILLSGLATSQLFLNDGTDFHESGMQLRGLTRTRIASCDINNDGKTDFFLSGNGGTYFYLNVPGGYEEYQEGLDEEDYIRGTGSIEVADYDNDGDLDVAIAALSSVILYTNFETKPNAPPSVPATLKSDPDTTSVTFRWARSNDDLTPSQSITYNLRIGTSPDSSNIMSAMSILATGKRLMPGHGNVWNDTVWTIRNLKRGTYYWSVQAIDNGYAASPFSAVDSFTVGPRSLPVVLSPGWNLVSLPLQVADSSYASIFLGETTPAYSFTDGSYLDAPTLSQGTGYWIKSIPRDTIRISGRSSHRTDVSINGGWTIIGPYDSTVAVGAITATPGDLVLGDFFGFQNGYARVASLEPGKGYWIKSSAAGVLHLIAALPKIAVPDSTTTAGWICLKFVDAQKSTHVIYLSPDSLDLARFELPPLPPSGVGDVRFESDRWVESLVLGSQCIRLRSLKYPVELHVSNSGGRRSRIADAAGGALLNVVLNGDGSVRINAALETIAVSLEEDVPVVLSLDQNYPNPFNPMTTIRFGLPNRSFVNLAVFNTLGQQVAILRNGESEAGYHEVRFDASGLSSGVYFYRIQAGDFVQVRKMVLVR